LPIPLKSWWTLQAAPGINLGRRSMMRSGTKFRKLR